MRALLVALSAVVLLAVGGAGLALAAAPVGLTTSGPTGVTGTEATAVFEVGDRTIRQVRYRDRGVLSYSFRLRNTGPVPVRIEGLAPLERDPKLFRYLSLTDERGLSRFEVAPGDRVTVVLRLRMELCERLSARAGSFASTVRLVLTRVGFVRNEASVTLPEELHTGSAREAACPRSTASSRPSG